MPILTTKIAQDLFVFFMLNFSFAFFQLTLIQSTNVSFDDDDDDDDDDNDDNDTINGDDNNDNKNNDNNDNDD